ncbi:hypothetical protein KXD40_001716 [Peronospora effusa]|uniref:Uncharacterized protein n=1 Tax=Peronospora effusa TaxID=542832 RepID=A0A3M6VU18_9STRA|nr:hypothetical protein DD238_000053 [Peronospora effusa]RQM08913.1 hypothetical protein DD237_000644 [Peronospora effusa]UIZ26052.1 hypothetical protein KXD40_001716 [Peronospora effusa]
MHVQIDKFTQDDGRDVDYSTKINDAAIEADQAISSKVLTSVVMEQNTFYNAVAKGHPVDAVDKDAVADNNFYEDTLFARSGDLSMLEYEDGTTTFDI